MAIIELTNDMTEQEERATQNSNNNYLLTDINENMDRIDANVIENTKKIKTGWTPLIGTYTYSNTTTITTKGSWESVLSAGMKIKLRNVTVKTSVIKEVTSTTIVLETAVLASGAITDVYFSTAQTPYGSSNYPGKTLFSGTLTTGSSTTIAELADYSLFVVYSYGSETGVNKPTICVKQTSTLTIDGVGGFYINTSIAGMLTMSFGYSGTTLTFSGGLYITHSSGGNHPGSDLLTVSKIIGLV